MPVLKNPKHEAFAQARAAGKTAAAAYKLAGYTENGANHDSNAARLSGNERVKARIDELAIAAINKVRTKVAFDVSTMLTRIAVTAQLARVAGDFKTALEAEKFAMECFGYKDHPTLTHEHMRTGLLTPPVPDPQTGEPTFPLPANVTRFENVNEYIRKLRGLKP